MMKRVVSLACTHTELLVAVGAGRSLVACDVHSDYPKDVVNAVPSNLDPWMSDPDSLLRQIDELEPDLVLVAYPFQAEILRSHGPHKHQILLLEAPIGDNWFEDIKAQYRLLASTMGKEADVEQLLSEMEEDFDSIRKIMREGEREDENTPTFFIETDADLYTASTATHLSKVLEDVCLLRNCVSSDSLYPQLEREEAISLNPDFWFIAHNDQTTFAQKYPEVASCLSATQSGKMRHLNNVDAANRYTPRLVDYAREVAEFVLKSK